MKIGVLDIGGTSIKYGLWQDGVLSGTGERDTDARQGGACVMERAVELLRGLGAFDAIGISTAGQVDWRLGSIRYANENIPGYTGIKVREIMEREFSVPAAVENDVNAAALGEGIFGAGQGMENFLCITYGTGVGGAIVTGGELYRGTSYSAGEFGGILIHPEDRREGEPFSGCYEKYASATALVREAMKVNTALDNGRKIFAALDQPGVAGVIDGWTDEIVHGLVTLVHIFNPSALILGGGVMAQPLVLEQVREKALKRMIPSFSGVRIERALLGNQAGLLGAAYLASGLDRNLKKG